MKILLSVVLILCVAGSKAQLMVTDSSGSIKDNAIFSESNNSNGAGTSLFVGRNGQGNNRRGLIKFALTNVHPDSVKSLSVRIHINQVSVVLPRTLRLHKLTSDWGEGTSSSSGGGGATPATNDATWNFRFFNTQTWGTAGGDYVAAASATLMVTDIGYYTFASQALLDDYKSWLANPASNFGWIIIGDETQNNSAKRMDSKEGSAVDVPKIFPTYNPVATPVTLRSFEAVDKGNFIRLGWQTESEFNNAYFNLKHSSDGLNYVEIARIAGAGNSSQPRTYSFDHTTSKGMHFYRLEMVDNNGRKEMSSVVSVNTGKNSIVSIYPNPVKDLLRIQGLQSGQISYSLLDITGQRVLTGNTNMSSINIRDLAPGVYTLELIQKSGVTRTPVIKK